MGDQVIFCFCCIEPLFRCALCWLIICEHIFARLRVTLCGCLNVQAQQNMTRWAVFQAATALRKHEPEFKALMAAMQQKKPVVECIKAIESA